MKLLKFKKRIEIKKTIGNVCIETFHYGAYDKEGKHKNWTELHCWYNCDCENCPASWEDWYGEDGDYGCYLAKQGEDYAPLWKCMLPRWAKKILVKMVFAREERRYRRKMEDEKRFCLKCNWNDCDYGCTCPSNEEVYQCPMYRHYHPDEVNEFNKAMEEWVKQKAESEDK